MLCPAVVSMVSSLLTLKVAGLVLLVAREGDSWGLVWPEGVKNLSV
jgi:hypothetical protein